MTSQLLTIQYHAPFLYITATIRHTDSGYIKFVSCILTNLQHHVCNCSHLNNVAYNLCRYVYDPSPYKMLYILKYFH